MDATTVINSILLGGGGTLIATQILKSSYVKIPFQKHPRSTTAVVSLAASAIAEYQAHIAIDFHNLPSLGVIFVGTLWVAISTYNHLNLKSN